MPLIRGKHTFDDHFTQIPNDWLRDRRLSYKARGLLAELLSHSVGWIVSRDRLARLGVDGRDAIASAIRELEDHGYLERRQGRNADGTMAETTWITKDPDEVSPPTDFPATAEPTTAKPPYKNTNDKNKKSKVYGDLFEAFWLAYPRKVGKGSAFKAFSKICLERDDLNPADIIAGANRLAADPNLPPQQYIPYPATWLGRDGWLDDAYPEREKTPEELAKIRAEKYERERQAAIEASRVSLEESEARRRALLENPVEMCEHDRIVYACPKCSIQKLAEKREREENGTN